MSLTLTPPPSIQSPAAERQTIVIFLDIDEVINLTAKLSKEQIQTKMKELFKGKVYPMNSDECSIAQTYFFKAEALTNLDTLISKIEEIAKVQIVISSFWRLNRNVEELKTTYFGRFNFSKYIIDKTIDPIDSDALHHYCSDPSHLKPYSSKCRAAEIQHWLNTHPTITNYIILDDRDDHLSLFKERFIQVDPYKLITPEIVDKAFASVLHQMQINV